MPLSRKESFRQASIETKSYREKIDDLVRSTLIPEDNFSISDIQIIADALKSISCNDTITNVKQEDLIPIFDEMNLRIGGHVLRQRLVDMGISLNATKFVDLGVISKLYLDIKKEMDNERSSMDFRGQLKNKKRVRTTNKLRDTTRDLGSLGEESLPPLPPKPNAKKQNTRQTSNLSDLTEISEIIEPIPASEQETEEFLSHHTYSTAERFAFSNWINQKLKNDQFCTHYLPIDPNSETDLFEKCTDGIILIRMIKVIKASLINDRVINRFNANNSERMIIDSVIDSKQVFQKIENLNLALNTAASIGCITVNQNAASILHDINPYLILGLLWQIIRAGLFIEIELEKSSEIFEKLKMLMADGEDLGKLYSLTPEEILVRWVNHHLGENERYHGNPIRNFGNDIKDSHAYQCLLQRLQELEKVHNEEEFSSQNKIILEPNYGSEKNVLNRAVHTLKMAENLSPGCKAFVTPKDIISGNQKLNTAFIANLFNQKMHLHKPIMVENDEEAGSETEEQQDIENYKETDEERVYKNWINSLDLKSTCNFLYTDLTDGVIILKLIDRISPGIVQWKKKVNFPPFKTFVQGGENCCYALDLAEEDRIGVKLAGCTRGHDINMGEPRNLTLGLVWQLMRSYTLSLLFSLASESSSKKLSLEDKDIIEWVNKKITESSYGPSYKIKNFKDSKLKTGHAIAICLDAIAKLSNPEAKIESTASKSSNNEELIENASYLIGSARKLGALVYTLPEHVVHIDSKMMLCLFITLMVLEKQEILNNEDELKLQKDFAAKMAIDGYEQHENEVKGGERKVGFSVAEEKELQQRNLVMAKGLRRRDTFRSRAATGSTGSVKPPISPKPVILPESLANNARH